MSTTPEMIERYEHEQETLLLIRERDAARRLLLAADTLLAKPPKGPAERRAWERARRELRAAITELGIRR